MALIIPTFELPNGLVVSSGYALITGFRLLADRSLELELSIWKDSEACGMSRDRIASKVLHIADDNPQYQALFGTVAAALYGYAQAALGASDYEGVTVYPGSQLIPGDQNTIDEGSPPF